MASREVLLLHGEETFLVQHEAARVLAAWREQLVSDFGFESLDATRLTPSQLVSAVQQAPFLDPYRVVVARGIAPGRADRLAVAVSVVPETTRLLLTVSGRLAPANRLLQAVSRLAGGTVRDFAVVKGRRLNEWASSRARELGLPAPAAAAVVRASPPDLGVIDSELRKLAGYVAGGFRLDAPALADLLAGGREDEIFQLTDRLLPHPRADAWSVVHNLMRAGMGATTIGYRLARHLALVLEVRTRQARGEELAQIQAEMREHPFVVQKAFEAARGVTPEQLRRDLKVLLDYEWEVKSGQVDADRGLEVALANL